MMISQNGGRRWRRRAARGAEGRRNCGQIRVTAPGCCGWDPAVQSRPI